MATDVERLLIRLEANASKFEREMNRAKGVSVRTTRDIESNFEKLNRGVSRAVGPIATSIVAALSVNEIKKAADTYTRALNQLRVAGVQTGQIAGVFDQLFASAQRNAVPIEALAQLYGRVSQAQTTLKATSGELLELTEIVAQSLRVSGASAESASGALLQLSQALSGGKVQAEEYNSLLDGMYPLLQAAAAGIKEAGGDVAKLTRLVKDGEVSSEAFFRGIQAGSSTLRDKLATSTFTVAQATTQMNNEFVRAVGEYDRLTGASGALAASLANIAGSLSGVAVAAANATNKVLEFLGAAGSRASFAAIQDKLKRGYDVTADEAREARTYLRSRGMQPTANAEQALSRAERGQVADFRRNEIATRDDPTLSPFAPLPPTRPVEGVVAQNPISLKRFPVGGKDDKGGAGSSREKLNEYEREVEQLRKKTELLKAEADAIGLGTIAVEKSKAVRELELAAKKAGVELSPAVKAAIEQEAEAFAAAKKTIEDKNRALEATKQLQELIGSSISSFFSDIVSGGENASKALMNLTKRLTDAALQAVILGQGPLASLFGTAGSKGGVGGIVGALFSTAAGVSGRAAGGPVSAGQPYIVGEKRPELFVPKTSGTIIPRVPTGGSGGNVSITQNFDLRGADTAPAMAAMIKEQAMQGAIQAVEARRAARPDYLSRGM